MVLLEKSAASEGCTEDAEQSSVIRVSKGKHWPVAHGISLSEEQRLCQNCRHTSSRMGTECRGAGKRYLCHLLGDFLVALHAFGFPFTMETHTSKGELALEDYQWLCCASRDKEKKRQMEKKLPAPTRLHLDKKRD